MAEPFRVNKTSLTRAQHPDCAKGTSITSSASIRAKIVYLYLSTRLLPPPHVGSNPGFRSHPLVPLDP